MRKNLSDHASSNCFVIIDDENSTIHFYSYTTRVITIKPNEENGALMVECTGTYSATTRRQIGWFLREYLPELNYYNMKDIVGKGFQYITENGTSAA